MVDDDRYREELIEQGEEVHLMTDSPGWKIIEKWIRGRIVSGIDSLMTCSVDEVPLKRSEVQVYRGILLKIDEIVNLGLKEEKRV